MPDYSKQDLPSSLQSLCGYAQAHEKIINFTIDKEVFGFDRETFILHKDIAQFGAMDEIGSTVIAVYMR